MRHPFALKGNKFRSFIQSRSTLSLKDVVLVIHFVHNHCLSRPGSARHAISFWLGPKDIFPTSHCLLSGSLSPHRSYHDTWQSVLFLPRWRRSVLTLSEVNSSPEAELIISRHVKMSFLLPTGAKITPTRVYHFRAECFSLVRRFCII